MSVRRRSEAQPWPHKAGRVADEVADTLAELQALARSMDRQMLALDGIAATGSDALRSGNVLLARETLADIRHRTATIRHTAATMLGKAGDAAGKLAAARVGEYGEG